MVQSLDLKRENLNGKTFELDRMDKIDETKGIDTFDLISQQADLSTGYTANTHTT